MNSTLSDSEIMDRTSVVMLSDMEERHFVVEAEFDATHGSENLNVFTGSSGNVLGSQLFLDSFNACIGGL